jgi:hypothetical protein
MKINNYHGDSVYFDKDGELCRVVDENDNTLFSFETKNVIAIRLRHFGYEVEITVKED